jgi:hypothetical protein
MGRLMAAVSARPPPTKLVSPTREFMLGMADLAPGETAAARPTVLLLLLVL